MKKWQKIIISLSIIFNIAIKIWFVYFNPSPQFTTLGGDAIGYNDAATHFSKWFFSGNATRPPVYNIFLKILYSFSEVFSLNKIKFVFFIQEMLNVLALAILLLVIDIIFPKVKGKNTIKVIFTLFYILYPPQIIANAVLLREGLNSFLVVLCVFLLLKYHISSDVWADYNILNRQLRMNSRKLYLFLFSFSFALCYLNREENVFFLFFVLSIFAFLFFFKHKKEFKRDTILLIILLYLFNYPWVMRNLLISQKNIFLSSLSGINISMGLMYDFPVYDDLRCPYLTDMFNLYAVKFNELGSVFRVIHFFFKDVFFNHSPMEIFKFYVNKIYSLFREPLIFHNYYTEIQHFFFSPGFQNRIHRLYLYLFALSLPFLWLHRKKIGFWIVYIFLFFVTKALAAVATMGNPRSGFSTIPFLILFASFSVYCMGNAVMNGLKLLWKKAVKY